MKVLAALILGSLLFVVWGVSHSARLPSVSERIPASPGFAAGYRAGRAAPRTKFNSYPGGEAEAAVKFPGDKNSQLEFMDGLRAGMSAFN